MEPDISVICDKNKLDEHGCNGAPDWVIEVISPSDPQRDYGVKLFKYRAAGVREYWIVNPMKNTVTVYDFENETGTNLYSWFSVLMYITPFIMRIESAPGKLSISRYASL